MGIVAWTINMGALVGWIAVLLATVDNIPRVFDDHADGWSRVSPSPTRLWKRVGSATTALEIWCALEVVRSLLGLLPKMNYLIGTILHYTRMCVPNKRSLCFMSARCEAPRRRSYVPPELPPELPPTGSASHSHCTSPSLRTPQLHRVHRPPHADWRARRGCGAGDSPRVVRN